MINFYRLRENCITDSDNLINNLQLIDRQCSCLFVYFEKRKRRKKKMEEKEENENE